jgi:hypothetical protein|tara:strand:- start:820 stop:1194 length:375 start_codon:yes stop_codon:yes gene_type:complete
MTTGSNPTSPSFDVSKYKIKEQNQTYTVKLEKDEFDVIIKPMTWQQKNELVARCMTFDDKGNSSFDSGIYIKEVLKEILIEAPWGKTTDEFLNSINQEMGSALEKLVPSAFESNFTEVDVIKKG